MRKKHIRNKRKTERQKFLNAIFRISVHYRAFSVICVIDAVENAIKLKINGNIVLPTIKRTTEKPIYAYS